jgi:hypothetical protein
MTVAVVGLVSLTELTVADSSDANGDFACALTAAANFVPF